MKAFLERRKSFEASISTPKRVETTRPLAALLPVVLILACALPGMANTYTVVDLGTLGGTFSVGQAINNSGQVAGYSSLGDGSEHAFLYGGGSMTDLGTLGGTYSLSNGINNNGQVTGYAATGDAAEHAFLYNGGSMIDLGTLGGSNSGGYGVNDSGQVTGYSFVSDFVYHAFLDSGGSMIDLGTLGGTLSVGRAINNSAQVTGYSNMSGDAAQHAFLYSGGSLTDLGTLGGAGSVSYGINNSGQVTGYSDIPGDAAQHAFLYSDGSMTDLGTLGGTQSIGYAINDGGQVAGASYISAFDYHAFLYSGGSMTDINPAGWSLTEAFGINDSGQITGDGTNPDGQDHGFLLTPVAAPEPVTPFLLVPGLLGLTVLVSKKTCKSCGWWFSLSISLGAFYMLLGPAPAAANGLTPIVVQNFSGLGLEDTLQTDGGQGFPPDQGSAVGPNNYMEIVNVSYAIYHKDGTRVAINTLSSLFANAGVPGLDSLSDPRLIYDQGSGHWFAAAITTDSSANKFVIAVSQSSDPTGAWKATSFVANTTPNNFADFPQIGVDKNAFYITSNNFLNFDPNNPDNNLPMTGAGLTTIPKADLINPAGPNINNRTHTDSVPGGGIPFALAPVSDFNGRNHGVIISADCPVPACANATSAVDILHRYNVLNPGSNPSTLTPDNPINVATYYQNQAAHQPDGTLDLDAGDVRIGSNNVYQVGNVIWVADSILTTATTGDSVYDAVRWYEINEATNTILQWGNISLPNHDLIYPSIAANAAGDVIIGFTGTGDSSTGDYPGAWYVSGTTNGGVTTFGAPVELVNGFGPYQLDFCGPPNPCNRWGDFSAISVDPTNPNAFWIAEEVASENPGDILPADFIPVYWGTQITELAFQSLTPAPEPAGLTLIGIGLVGLAVYGKRSSWRRP